jgi:hypothetical protein
MQHPKNETINYGDSPMRAYLFLKFWIASRPRAQDSPTLPKEQKLSAKVQYIFHTYVLFVVSAVYTIVDEK